MKKKRTNAKRVLVRRFLFLSAIASLVLVLVAQVWLRSHLTELRHDLKQLERTKNDRDTTARMAYWARVEESRYEDNVKKKLSNIDSLTDFPVGTGSRFIVTQLSSKKSNEFHIGFYAPAGTHQLVLLQAIDDRFSYQRGDGSATESKSTVVTIPIPAEKVPGVFEFEFSQKPDTQSVTASMFTDSGQAVDSQTYMTDSFKLNRPTENNCRDGIICYPSEIQLPVNSERIWSNDDLAPKLSLMSWSYRMRESSMTLELRIESDAPACISAHGSIRYAPKIKRIFGLLNDCNYDEYDRLFRPYTGGLVRVIQTRGSGSTTR